MKYSFAAAATLLAATASAAPAPGSFFSKSSSAPSVGGKGSILDITGRVFLAQRAIVENQGYPSAVILEAQIDPEVEGSLVTDPETQLTKIHAVFRVEETKDGKDYKSVEIFSNGWSTFAEAIPREQFWMGSAAFDIQEDLVYSVGDLFEKCKTEKHCPAKINSVTIRQPLQPKFSAPHYIFNSKKGHVFYNAKTGEYTDSEA